MNMKRNLFAELIEGLKALKSARKGNRDTVSNQGKPDNSTEKPLKGSVVRYDDPTKPVE